jgi:hypothetical protein
MRQSVSAQSILGGPWEPIVLLPSQLAKRSERAHSPEFRLVVAMFEEALRCVVSFADVQRGRQRRDFVEARDWFLDDGLDWPFGFVNVCDLLGLDAEAVRRSLRPLIGSRGSTMK